MIILVEGPDNTGKTTLCKKICAKYGFEYTHSGVVDDLEKQDRDLLKYLRSCKANGISVMVDRAQISDIIYSEVFRGGADYLSDELYFALENIMDKTVICIPDDKDEYIDRYMREKDAREDLFDDMSEVYDLYQEYIDDHEDEVILYDWTTMTKDEINEFIEELVEE